MTSTAGLPDAAPSGSAEPPLPTFLIIGAQKSATRWLRTNLGAHPDVFTVERELAFFSNEKRFRELGLDWYRAQFGGWSGQRIVGEGTPAYMVWRHHPDRVAVRIDESLPGVRLLAILRNPIDRAASAMLHHIRRERLAPRSKLVELARATPPEQDLLTLISGGWYARSLEPYRDRFGDRLQILFHDDVVARPREVYETAAAHIGISDDFVPPDLETVVFSNRERSPEIATELTHDERVELWQYFRDDVRELEQMTGRDLSAWDPTAA